MLEESSIAKAIWTIVLNLNKLLDAWNFTKSIGRSLFFIAERIHGDLGITFPKIKFGLRGKLQTIAHYMLNESGSWYTYLLVHSIIRQFLK